MILKINFREIEKLMEVQERMLCYCVKDDRVVMLLDTGTSILFQCDALYKDILSDYVKKTGKENKEAAVDYFIRYNIKNRPHHVEYYDENPVPKAEMIAPIDNYTDLLLREGIITGKNIETGQEEEIIKFKEVE